MKETRIVAATEGIEEAVRLLRAGDVVGFPTETVYGLAGDATSEIAVRRIYEVKGRPAGNPSIVHVASIESGRTCAASWPGAAEKLAAKFWPGPLTVIVKRGPAICSLVSAGRETVAIRWPRHPVAQKLIEVFGRPVAAPSANRSGFTSPTTANHVMAELSGRIPLILDGGPCEIGLESTVIDATAKIPTILRPGAITAEMLREVLGEVTIASKAVTEGESAESPGQHSRHYAPRHMAYRFACQQWSPVKSWAERHGPVALLSPIDAFILPAPHETVRMPDSAEAYAKVLYAALRDADDRRINAIIVVIPESSSGVWAAVHDRLRRATVEWKS